MLKITSTTVNAFQTKLVLEGKLVDPWLSELERVWDEMRSDSSTHSVLVDLKDVTAISERGQQLLRRMAMEGATVNCCRGVFTKHVVRTLAARIRGCHVSKEK